MTRPHLPGPAGEGRDAQEAGGSSPGGTKPKRGASDRWSRRTPHELSQGAGRAATLTRSLTRFAGSPEDCGLLRKGINDDLNR